MKFGIYAKNYNVSDKLKDVTGKKLAKLDKYFSDEDVTAKVTCKVEGNSCVTEIMLDYNGKLVRATNVSDNFYDNLDAVLPKLEGQIRKHRTKFDKHNKNSAYTEAGEFENSEKTEKASSKLVKTKSFKLTPMTVKEAEEEMDMIGHSFYVFLEAKTHTVQVLYRRNDGDIGLIEPQID